MAKREQASVLNGINAFNTQVINSDTTTNGVIIDTQKYNAVTFIIQSGTITAGTIAVNVQEGDESNLSDAASVSSDFLRYPNGVSSANFAATDDNLVKRVGVISNKR